MIFHSVAFTLKHPEGSEEEQLFLKKARNLCNIPDVIDLRVMSQVGQKNNFKFGLTMYFASEATYQTYNEHPDHLDFVENVWLPQVTEFMEIDYVEITP